MVISTKQKLAILKSQTEQLNLHIHDKDRDGVQSIKYLGVHIDNTLDWKKRIQEVPKKISRSLGLIKYAKQFLSLSHLKTFTPAWLIHISATVAQSGGVCGLADIQQLQKFENRAARIITGGS